MSLMKTLARVAIGVAVAKGVSTLAKGSGRSAPGGLDGMMGDILGKSRNGGSLGGLLNELGGAGSPRRTPRKTQPDLGAVLGQLGGGSGGLGGLLGQLATAGAAGGLGGVLGGALSGKGGIGGLLDQALRNGGEPDTTPAPEQELTAAILLRAMIQAAKSDGQIDATEQARLMDQIGEVTAEERAFVQAELDAPVDPEGLAQSIPDGLETQAYMMSLMAIDLDNQAEAQYLDRLARALDLPPDAINQIHDKLGAPRLYA